MQPIELGHIYGLRITAKRSAIVAFAVLWLILSLVTIGLFHLSPLEGIFWAFLGTFLHFFSELFHQLGHARAARRVGYPMIGVRFWYFLGQSIYPKDEPPLPGSIHIRRALGGPAASFGLALIGFAVMMVSVALIQPDPSEANILWTAKLNMVGVFLFLDNLLVFTLGALLPLGFTDGSTILYWWRKSGADK